MLRARDRHAQCKHGTDGDDDVIVQCELILLQRMLVWWQHVSLRLPLPGSYFHHVQLASQMGSAVKQSDCAAQLSDDGRRESLSSLGRGKKTTGGLIL